MIYLVCFVLSALSANGAMKARTRQTFLFLSLLSISVTVILAGLRDYSIGIDVKNYLSFRLYWQGAINRSSLADYLVYYASSGGTEYIFAVFIGAIAQITGEYRVFIFLSHIIIITGVYIGAYRLREYAHPVLTLTLFYLFFFNHSLNIIRQYIAMAIVFAIIKDLLDRKYLKYSFFVIIACLVHISALLSFGLAGIYYLLYENQKYKNAGGFRKFGIYCILIAVLVGIVPIVEWLISSGILNSKYMYYLNSESAVPTTIVQMLVLLELICAWIFRKSIRRRFELNGFFLFGSITYLFLQLTTSFIVYGKRIAAYYSLVNIITIGMIHKSQKGKGSNYQIVTAIIILIALVYWFYMYVYNNASQTYPYRFFFMS